MTRSSQYLAPQLGQSSNEIKQLNTKCETETETQKKKPEPDLHTNLRSAHCAKCDTITQ